jgi:Recombinase
VSAPSHPIRLRLTSGLPKVLPIIRKAQKAGATSLRAIAQVLNDRGIPKPRGGTWAPMQVKNILDRSGD